MLKTNLNGKLLSCLMNDRVIFIFGRCQQMLRRILIYVDQGRKLRRNLKETDVGW